MKTSIYRDFPDFHSQPRLITLTVASSSIVFTHRFLHTQLSARSEVAHSQRILDREVVLVDVWTATEVFGHRLKVLCDALASFGPNNWRESQETRILHRSGYSTIKARSGIWYVCSAQAKSKKSCGIPLDFASILDSFMKKMVVFNVDSHRRINDVEVLALGPKWFNMYQYIYI